MGAIIANVQTSTVTVFNANSILSVYIFSSSCCCFFFQCIMHIKCSHLSNSLMNGAQYHSGMFTTNHRKGVFSQEE